MNSRTVLPPVRSSVTVEASVEEAFEIFTAGIGSWWPRGGSHTLLKAPLADVVIEPFPGGRWYHRGVDGSECENGRVLAWEPPGRLVLGWQLNGRWEYVPDRVSEVEVRFVAIGGGRVQVTLEHRDFEAFDDTAAALRMGVEGASGWPLLLGLYRDRVAQGAADSPRAA